MTVAWYVIQVRARREAAVAADLVAERFEVFAPEYLRRMFRNRRRILVPAPLFPGYVFVRFDVDYDIDDKTAVRWEPINRMPGVVGVLASSGREGGAGAPLAVPDQLMVELHNSVGPSGYLDVTDETKPIRYRKGQYLRIIDGTFQGFIGLYIGSDRQRVGVLLDILGGARTVQIPEEQVTLAEQPGAEQPGAEQPGAEQPGAEQPAAGQLAPGHPMAGRPRGSRASFQRARRRRAPAAQPIAER